MKLIRRNKYFRHDLCVCSEKKKKAEVGQKSVCCQATDREPIESVVMVSVEQTITRTGTMS